MVGGGIGRPKNREAKKTGRNMAITIILLLIGTALLVNTIWQLTNSNVNEGIVAQGLLAILFLGCAGFGNYALVRWLTWGTVAVTLLVCGFSIFLLVHGRADNVTGDEDVVIVLGAAVLGDRVSPTLANRLDAAYRFFQEHPQALIVVSGGKGMQERVSEASAMREYLLAKGVSDSQIRLEDKATSTSENFAFSKALLDAELGAGYKVAFATSDYHVFRSTQIAVDQGLTPTHLHAPTRWSLLVSSCLRETAVLTINQITGG
ncbi:MAG: YdcF family protein [Propionibacteriaceae bacterium]|nr:YdcF family protein [Propionibacteriaceae bacterium]